MARCPCGRVYPCTTHGIESACNSVSRNVTPFMGYTVRVEDWRYTCWIPFDGTSNRGEWAAAATDSQRSEELYDHHGDTGENWADGFENENVAHGNKALVSSLFDMVRARFDTPGPAVWPPGGSAEQLQYSGDDE